VVNNGRRGRARFVTGTANLDNYPRGVNRALDHDGTIAQEDRRAIDAHRVRATPTRHDPTHFHLRCRCGWTHTVPQERIIRAVQSHRRTAARAASKAKARRNTNAAKLAKLNRRPTR